MPSPLDFGRSHVDLWDTELTGSPIPQREGSTPMALPNIPGELPCLFLFALLHWPTYGCQNTTLFQLSAFTHVASTSLRKFTLFQDRALALSDTGEEHSVGKKIEELWLLIGHLVLDRASGLLPLQQRWRWSGSYKSLSSLSFPETTSYPSVRLQDWGLTRVQSDRKCFPLSHPLWQSFSICLLVPIPRCQSSRH